VTADLSATAGLPGADLVEKGLDDLAAGLWTAEAWLVLVGGPRLRGLGVAVPPSPAAHPEHELYAVLCVTHGRGAHSQYNALIRRLVSFERALTCAR
jgi:hypothetical protein